MRVRPLEMWVWSLFLAIAAVAALQQYTAYQRANEPASPYSITVKASRPSAH